jgi:hypothetical protein
LNNTFSNRRKRAIYPTLVPIMFGTGTYFKWQKTFPFGARVFHLVTSRIGESIPLVHARFIAQR